MFRLVEMYLGCAQSPDGLALASFLEASTLQSSVTSNQKSAHRIQLCSSASVRKKQLRAGRDFVKAQASSFRLAETKNKSNALHLESENQPGP
jgi:hypothetical protein